MADKDIREDVLCVISSQENERSGGGTDLRVIRWVVDGKPGKPMLEKRDWYLTPEGDRKAGKAKGMTAGDLYMIIKNIQKIAALLEVKPEHLNEALAQAMFREDKPSTASTQGRPSSTTPPPQSAGVPKGAAPAVKF